jgi:hypothetical protein
MKGRCLQDHFKRDTLPSGRVTSGPEPRDTLAGLRDTADRVLELLHDVFAGDPATRIARRRAWRLASALRTRASQPVCVALVGAPSAGTTDLAGALLGRAGLPGALSAPGQVTAIRVGQAGPGTGTRHPAVSVTYLSRHEVTRAARFMLGRLIEFVRREELRYDMTGLNDDDPVQDGFRAFEDVARSWWAAAGDRHAELRARAWELLRLRDALAVGSDLLDDAGGRPMAADPAALGAAIGIGGAREVPRAFPELPDDPPVPRGARLTAEVLRKTLPLIGRITCHADVTAGVWDPGGLRDDNGLVILDVPGPGAAGGSRAEYLCREELATVTTVVEVLDAAQPSATAARMFATVLENRRRSTRFLDEPVLVAANDFDKVVPPPAAGQEIPPDRLRGETAALDALQRTLAMLGHDHHERVALTSAVPGTRDPRWAAVATALEDGGETGAAAALRAYLDDGGIARLRELIDRHVAGALDAEMGDLLRLRAELREALGLLRALTRSAPDGPPGEAAQKRLADLVDGLSNAAAALRAGAASFRDPQELMVADGDGSRVGLLTRIGREAALAAYRWPAWDALLDEVRDGQLPVSPAAGQDGAADDLRDAFDQALAELRGTARRFAEEVLAGWVRQHDRHVAGVRDEMRDPEVQRLLVARLAVLDAHDHGDARLQQLGRIVELGWVPGRFARALEDAEDRAAAAGASACPLAGHALPWHQGGSQGPDPGRTSRRHHSAVHRLRHDLAEGLAFPVQAAVATAFGHLAVQLEAEFRTLLGRIPVQAELLAPAGAGPAAGPAGARDARVLDDLILDLTGVASAGEAT